VVRVDLFEPLVDLVEGDAQLGLERVVAVEQRLRPCLRHLMAVSRTCLTVELAEQ